MDNYRILVVDDEEDICEVLSFNLEMNGYRVDTAYSAEEALAMDLTLYDLILLDVMMGEISGFRMAEMLKKDPEKAKIPVVFLTAKDAPQDTLYGFHLGADDYISKPFYLKEVIARVKAVLQRTSSKETPTDNSKVGYKRLVIDLKRKIASINGGELCLTKKEFEIMTLLLKNPERVFSREDLLDRIWNNETYVFDRTVDVNITRLRKKLGEYGKYIVTRPGYGYCFDPA